MRRGPDEFAELIAPAVDRAFIAGMRATRGAGGVEVVRSYGGPQAVGFLIDLRNPLAAGRAVGPDVADGPYRYHDPAEVRQSIQRSAAHGLLALSAEGSFTATDQGQAFLAEMYALHATVLAQRWEAEHGRHVERLVTLVGTLLDAAHPTGGPAWAVFAPPHEPPGSPPGRLLLNRLSTLRAHRADAHAAAWQAAGMTADQIVAMPPGPARDALEDETNVRAGIPYAALTAHERLTMLADLAALP